MSLLSGKKGEDQGQFDLGYAPALDGLRGVSILAVIAFNGHMGLSGGFLGVNIFFVLSGFLITTLLCQEFLQSSKISLKNFYLRRALRLLPALFALIIACVVYAFVFQSKDQATVTLKGVLYTLFYVANWAQVPPNLPGIGALSHAWSLSVEEQFYIIWPLILIGLIHLKSRLVAFSILGLTIIASVAVNVWMWHAEVPYLRMYFGTDTKANEILIGCVAGLLMSGGYLKQSVRLKSVLHLLALVGVGFILISFVILRHDQWFVYNGGFTMVALLSAVLIIDVLLFPSVVSRCLQFSPLVWIGKISYGLYLWHFPIFEATRKFLEARVGPIFASIVGFAMTLLIATASYYLLERPFLSLKKRFESSEPAKLATANYPSQMASV